MIIDGRRGNARLSPPPHVDLASPETFASIEIEVPDSYSRDKAGARDFLASCGISIGVADISDCFHRLVIPAELSRYYCLEPVRAEDVGLVGEVVEGRTVVAGEMLYPCPRSLPMGCSWAVYFCQRAAEYQMSQLKSLRQSILVSDKKNRILNGSVIGGVYKGFQSFYYVYIDNLGVITTSEKHSREAIDEVCHHFTSLALSDLILTRLKSLAIPRTPWELN